jgi:hypothetical protein
MSQDIGSKVYSNTPDRSKSALKQKTFSVERLREELPLSKPLACREKVRHVRRKKPSKRSTEKRHRLQRRKQSKSD